MEAKHNKIIPLCDQKTWNLERPRSLSQANFHVRMHAANEHFLRNEESHVNNYTKIIQRERNSIPRLKTAVQIPEHSPKIWIT